MHHLIWRVIRCDELMFQGFFNVDSLNWIGIQQTYYEIFCKWGYFHLLWEFYVVKSYLFTVHVHYFLLEWRFSHQQFICQYAHTPYINFLIITLSTQLLRAAVLQTTHNCLPHSICLNWTPEISQFHVSLINKNILWLNVPVNNLTAMHKRKPLAYLINYGSCLLLWCSFSSLYLC